jgi:hypothetical protein
MQAAIKTCHWNIECQPNDLRALRDIELLSARRWTIFVKSLLALPARFEGLRKLSKETAVRGGARRC